MLIAINLVILVLAAVVALRSVVVVPAGHAFVVESFGKYDRTLRPGIAVLVPFVETVRFRHSTADRMLDLDSPNHGDRGQRRGAPDLDRPLESDGRSTRDRPSASALRG
jgi:regulator of protease activity HflC (stomatin/prohibitin superfamily)